MNIENNISVLIIDKTKDLIQKFNPTVAQIFQKIGVTPPVNLNSLASLPCLPQNELQNISIIRNNLVNALNTTAVTIETLSKTLNVFTPVLNTTKKSLNIAQTTVKVAEAALIAVPPSVPIPFSVLNAYIKADKLINITLPPIITQTSNKINSISTSIDYANKSIYKLITTIEPIDEYISKCLKNPNDINLVNLNDYNTNIVIQYSKTLLTDQIENIYKGFTLEIVEVPFSPTVNRRKAVAKNPGGIILLETPLSFTTENQVLIDLIKLIIDSNDLEAY